MDPHVERYMDLEEYLAAVKLPRSTFFALKKARRLREGTHYVKLGRALRFPFPQALEAPLFEVPVPLPSPGPAPEPVAPPCRRRHGRTRGVRAIDLGYRP